MKLTGENRSIPEKPVPVPLSPPYILHGLTSGLRGERPATPPEPWHGPHRYASRCSLELYDDSFVKVWELEATYCTV